MGKDQPLICFVNKKIRRHVNLSLGRLIVNRCDFDNIGCVAAALLMKFAQDGIDAEACIKDVVDDEKFVVGADVVDDITEAVNADFGAALGDAAIG